MPAVNIPTVGRVHFPEGMPLSEIEAVARSLASNVGRDPNTGNFDPDLAILDASANGNPLPPPTISDRLRNVPLETSLPLVLGTMGSLAFPPSAAGGLLARFAPPIAASAVGGGLGGAGAESTNPDSTAGSITRAGLRSGAEMAAAEALGLGIAGLANRAIAPNIPYADPMKPVRERIAASRLPEMLRSAASRIGESLPQTGRVGAAVQRAGRVAGSPLGGEVLEATVVPAATAAFGWQVGLPLYLGRAMFAPGVLQRYLSANRLPSELVRTVGRQYATTAVRAGLLAEEESDQ